MDPSADFASLEDLPDAFATLPVDGEVHAGDAGTFACHTSVTFPAGLLDVYEVDVGCLALLRGHRPVEWPEWGSIVSDTAQGVILTAAAHAEVDEEEDESWYFDAVDEAELPATVPTRSGLPMAVFTFLGDGTYPVAIGRDTNGAVCALLIYHPGP